ncbi:2-methylcitrate dehydratase PrpD [Cadophora sp. DSE1049]|nr:2-methylcitrate dehydratase PrpD [Cadophora sp. DSE1049]
MMTEQRTDPKGPTGQLCSWLSSLKLSDIPEPIKTRAKYLLLDGVGCALVGAHLPWSEKAAKVHFDLEPVGGTCDVFGWEKKITPLSAALVNGTFIQGFELDDWHSEAPLHSNAVIIPALFSAVATQNQSLANATATVTGADFLLGYLAGLEVGPRVGNALHGSHMLTMGWHSGAVFGGSASAASVSKMFGLNADAVEDALGIACTQACGLMSAQFESEVKRMQHGFAARNGLLAALLTKGAYIGIKRKEPRFLQDEVSKDLGKTWKTEGVRVKPYAAMAVTHGAVDCVRILQKEHPDLMEDLEGIEKVALRMGDVAYHHGGWKAVRPLTSVGAQMSAAYVSVTQMVDREVMPRQFRSDMLERDVVWRLVEKVICVQDNGLRGGIGATVAEVVWKNGKRAEASVEDARGVNPELSNEEIVEKWRGLMKGVIHDRRRDEIERTCLGIEELDDVMALGNLLAGMSKNVIA